MGGDYQFVGIVGDDFMVFGECQWFVCNWFVEECFVIVIDDVQWCVLCQGVVDLFEQCVGMVGVSVWIEIWLVYQKCFSLGNGS